MALYIITASYSNHSAYITQAETLDDAAGKAQWARNFYEPMYHGTVRIAIDVACEACAGNGRIAKGRRNVRFPKYTDCTTCKASGCLPVPAVA